MRRINKILLPVLIFLILAVHTNSFAQNNFLWQIHTKKSTVYVLGSIHLLKQDAYPLSKTIESAFARSGYLAVEANVNNLDLNNMQKFVVKGIYPEGDSLVAHISAETLETLTRETDRMGMPPQIVYKQRPWLLALTLQSLELMASGYKPEYGIDQHFLSKAGKRKKIIELESMDYQLDLLSGFSDEEQELFLLYTLKELAVSVEKVDSIVNAWKTGDTKLMESIIEESSFGDERMYPIQEKLILRRNRNMTAKIDGFLRDKGTYFVVVGAAHLLGEQGIIQQLKEKGYTVEQM